MAGALTVSQRRVLQKMIALNTPFQEYPGGFFAPESSAKRSRDGYREFPFFVLEPVMRSLISKGYVSEFSARGKKLYRPTGKAKNMDESTFMVLGELV